MSKTKRLSVVLTPVEKTVVELLAEAEGGFSQRALVRPLMRNAAREQDIWPPDRHRPIRHQAQGVQRG